MGLLGQRRGFVLALRSGAGADRKPRHRGDAVAGTAGEALPPTGTSGMADRSRVYEQIADGAENYDRSFEED